jgi:hypothetical protein
MFLRKAMVRRKPSWEASQSYYAARIVSKRWAYGGTGRTHGAEEEVSQENRECTQCSKMG